MQVQVNTDRTIAGSEKLVEDTTAAVQNALSRFADKLTRVEVFFSDENSHKGGADDKVCRLEARPRGLQPVIVTHKTGEVIESLDGATEKLERLLDGLFGKLDQKKGNTSMAGEQGF